MRKIRVLIADDSALMRKFLRELLSSDPEIEVVDAVRDGEEAVSRAVELRPDVITMDVNMPKMDGLTALQYILHLAPCPVVMISSLTTKGALVTLEALELGAVDFIPKPDGTVSLGIKEMAGEIIRKVKAAARAKVRINQGALKKTGCHESRTRRTDTGASRSQPLKFVVIGVSTGGPRTLCEVLPKLPGDLQASVAVVQHMPEGFTASFAERLRQYCQMEVKEADEGDEMLAGRILIARGNYHLKFHKDSRGMVRAHLSKDPRSALYIPSVDVTIRSLLEHVEARRVIGVLLTGMGDDGADGLVEIRKRGGFTIAESEETAVVWGMPREAYERGGVDVLAPSYAIWEKIVQGVRGIG